MDKLFYDSPLFTTEGITGAARNYVVGLNKYYDILCSDVRYLSILDPTGDIKKSYNLIDFGKDDFIHVKNTRPENWMAHNTPNFFGYHVLEGDRLPKQQVTGIKSCDNLNAVLVPSQYVKNMMKKSMVGKPIEVMPHIINPDFKPAKRNKKDKTTFLNNSAIYGLTKKDRKGVDVLLNAWEEYGNDDDKELILKINTMYAQNFYAQHDKMFDLRTYLRNLIDDEDLPKNVHILDKSLTYSGLIDLYQQSDCLLAPTRGEGFGLVPFEAMASGTPCIVTEKQGCEEFLNDDIGGFKRIKIERKIDAEKRYPYYDGKNLSKWDEPSLTDFCDKIAYFLNNKKEMKQEALEASKFIHNDFSYKAIGDKYHNVLESYLN